MQFEDVECKSSKNNGEAILNVGCRDRLTDSCTWAEEREHKTTLKIVRKLCDLDLE